MAFYDDDDFTAFPEGDETPAPSPEEEAPTEEGGLFDEFDQEQQEETMSDGGEPDNNKTFLVAVAGLIGFLVLAMALLAAYAIFKVPAKRHAQETEVAARNAQNTAIALGLTATAEAASWTATPTAKPPTPTAVEQVSAATATSTPTPVVAQPSETAVAPIDPTAFALTATAIAATNASTANLPMTPTALADTGFADHVGLPGMAVLAALLLVVVFLARRLRQSV